MVIIEKELMFYTTSTTNTGSQNSLATTQPAADAIPQWANVFFCCDGKIIHRHPDYIDINSSEAQTRAKELPCNLVTSNHQKILINWETVLLDLKLTQEEFIALLVEFGLLCDGCKEDEVQEFRTFQHLAREILDEANKASGTQEEK